jgi:predicted nucleic acid-binding protein
MSHTILLDTGPRGEITNPKASSATFAVAQWAAAIQHAGHRLVVPAIADYEVRRELERAGKTAGLRLLDAFNAAAPARYLPLTDAALKRAATLWAQARNAGTPTADPKELGGDVILAAQAFDLGLPLADLIIATTNVGHLARFAPADLWTNITP